MDEHISHQEALLKKRAQLLERIGVPSSTIDGVGLSDIAFMEALITPESDLRVVYGALTGKPVPEGWAHPDWSRPERWTLAYPIFADFVPPLEELGVELGALWYFHYFGNQDGYNKEPVHLWERLEELILDVVWFRADKATSRGEPSRK